MSEVVTIITEPNCNKELISCFIDELKQSNKDYGKIYLIADNAGYNKANDVKEKAEASGITIKYLPAYCPNLNIIERLWKFFKKKITKNKYYQEFTEFEEKITDFFSDISKYKEELYSLLI